MSEEIKEYVLGFAFSDDKQRVLLIRKEKPEWQKGLLNGIGGKIEEGETSLYAMHRECREESGLELSWKFFAKLKGRNFRVYCYRATGNIDEYKQMEKEELMICDILDVIGNRNNLLKSIRNVPMLVAIALSESDYTYIDINYR